MPRPLIGITTSLTDGEQRLRFEYLDAVAEAGGTPVLLPMLDEPSDATQLLDLIDGLIIIGGPAIEEHLIGSLPPDISPTHPRRLSNDRFALRKTLERGRPYLGICYGMQLLNAQFGGSIYADVQLQRDASGVHSEKRMGEDHEVHFSPGSALNQIWGEQLNVNTRHLQAVAEVGAGLLATGHAPDGVIEGIEDQSGTLLGVQFHPERMGRAGLPVFKYLVQRSAED